VRLKFGVSPVNAQKDGYGREEPRTCLNCPQERKKGKWRRGRRKSGYQNSCVY